MPTRTTPVRHRLEFAGAVLLAVGAVYGLSRISRLVKGGESPTEVAGRPAAPATFVQAPPIVPRVDPPLPPLAPKVSSTLSPEFLAAAREGNVARMTALYAEGLPVANALAAAAESGSVEAVTWILDHGADVHADELSTEAPVLAADAHPAVVRLLLARGAHEPSVTVAAEALAENAVKRILAKGESARPADGSAPLHAALVASADAAPPSRRRAVVDALLAGGADANYGEPAPLAVAIQRCHDAEPERPAELAEGLALVRALVAHGATVDAGMLSSAFEVPGVVIDALLAGRLASNAATLALETADGERNADVVKKLLAHPIAWSYRDDIGVQHSPLFVAAEAKDARRVRAMLAAGAPANLRSGDGTTALGLVLDGTPADPVAVGAIVEALVEHGASPNLSLEYGNTPLHMAAAMGSVRAVSALLAHGARVNVVSRNGTTALDEAELADHEDAARIIAAHGGRHPRIITE